MARYAKSDRRETRRNITWLVIAVLMTCIASHAQLTFGDYLNMRMNGNLGFGYTGSFGNADFNSNHSQGFSGNANLTGYYFHPSFFSFEFRPYYDRSQSNADSQTITRGTGFGGGASFFGGSRFPGSISFGQDFSSNTEFRVAGVPSVLGDSSGHNFGVSWSALVPNMPQVRMHYLSTTSASTVFGSDNQSHSSNKNLFIDSDYSLAGFDLRANFNHDTSKFSTPDFLFAEPLTGGQSGSTYGVSAQHRLPLSGNLALGWSHSAYGNAADDNHWTGTSYTEGVGFNLWRRLSLYQNLNYLTNLNTVLNQFAPNGLGTSSTIAQDSKGLFLSSGAALAIGWGFNLNAYYNQRHQSFQGLDFDDNQYGGTISFNRMTRLLGMFYIGVGAVDNASKAGNNGAGLLANVGMSRKFGHWDTSADFNYAQNVQTLGSVVTTSSYGYGASIRRKLTQTLRWNASFRGSHSGIVRIAGNGNSAESFNTSISWKQHNFSGSYSQSDGTAVLTSNGDLSATPVGSLITNQFLLFNARSYGVNASTRFFRRLRVSGGYVKFTSDTTQGSNGLTNRGQSFNVRTEYMLRKFSLQGGYNRAVQDVSTVPGGPRNVNVYFVSLTRWFNVF